MDISTIVFIIVLIISIILHEVSHGFMANFLGDPTAKLQGRLTLNPIKHIDPIGSILLPALLIFSGSKFLFGWAKPVPFNPYNLKRGGRFAEALVALAGPMTNIAIAFFVVLLYKTGLVTQNIAFMAVYMNVFLAFLNLLPIPPLDGSKILPAFLPKALQVKLEGIMRQIEQGGIMTMILVLFLLSSFAVRPLTHLVTYITVIMLTI